MSLTLWSPRLIATAGGACAMAVGSLTLLGYAVDAPRLTDWLNEGISMFPNAAACALLSGVGLLVLTTAGHRRSWRLVVRVVAGAVALVGGLTLLEHLSGVNLGIDSAVLSARTWGQRAAAAPMRMGPPASTSYLVIGVGLLLATSGARARRQAGVLAIVVVAIALLSMVGYWFGANLLFGVARFTGIALQTSLALAAIGVGLIASVPEAGLAGILRSDDPGGLIVRRLLLPIIAAPLLLSWLRVWGQEAGYFDTAFGTALLSLTLIAMLVAVLGWTARGVSRQARLARAAEEGVRDREARYRSLFEVSVYGVLTIDERGIIESANPAAERLFGRTAGEIIRRNVSMLMPDPYRREHDSYLENYRRTGQRRIIGVGREVEGLRKDGSRFPIDLAVSEFSVGEKRLFMGMISDISDRKQLERERAERAAKLSAALARRTEEVRVAEQRLARAQRLAAVGTMASGLAHDINNITAPLALRIDGLLTNPSLAADVRGELAVITALIDHLRLMAKNLSLFSRDPEQEGTGGSTDLASWWGRVRELIEASLAGKDGRHGAAYVRLKWDVPAALPRVKVAPHRLTQAVFNLVQNARDAILTGRNDGVSAGDAAAACITVEARPSEGMAAVLLKVIDDGCGMDEPTRTRAVEPFFTTKDRPTAAGAAGSGIGLSLVQAICERAGGSLDIQSQPGKGTTVTLSLPAAAEAGEAALAEPKPRPQAAHGETATPPP